MASIKKISERKYKITVCNGYRPDGRKISRAKTITVPDKIRRSSIPQYVAHTAEEFERRLKSGYSEDGEMSFEEYSKRWLERQIKYAPSTIASYTRMLERVYPYIGSIKLCQLRPVALENMMIELRKRRHHGKPIQEKTVQKYLTVVSAVLSDAKRNEIIQKNPARMLDLPEAKNKEQFIPTDIEARRFLEVLANIPSFVYCTYYTLAIYTGCRRGELCALKWSDFELTQDRRRSVLTVSRSRSTVPGKGIQEGPTKNKKSRKIFIDEDITGIVLSLCHMQHAAAKRKGLEMSEYLFVNDEQKPIHPDTFTKYLRRLYDANGFPSNFHLHTLRHYFVSAMLHNGVDKQTVAELAGHGDTSFLERTYCHPQMELKRKAAEQFTVTLFSGGMSNMSQSEAV